MNSRIQKLIESGAVICGRIIREDGIVRFERLDPSQIESIPEEERGYATFSMGRAVFSIDGEGRLHHYKGVDSHLDRAELGIADLVNARTIEFTPVEGGCSIDAVVFNNKNPEIRVKGGSYVVNIEEEARVNRQLSQMGVKVPIIKTIRAIPDSYSLRYGLPIDAETMVEYLERIGFLSSQEVQDQVQSLGYPMDAFIDAVDRQYTEGQSYGQEERIVGTPFRISDLEICIANANNEQLQAIWEFNKSNDTDFEKHLAETFGKNIATLLNNGWECENLVHRQDFSLSGEFCDDAYFSIFQRKAENKEKHKDEPYKADALMSEYKRKYTGQVMHIASCIKIVQDSMKAVGRSQTEIDGLLESFVDSFIDSLDFQKASETFNTDAKNVETIITNEFKPGQNWVEKMSAQNRREGIIYDEAIYNSHVENEDYYENVAAMIYDRLRHKSKDTIPEDR